MPRVVDFTLKATFLFYEKLTVEHFGFPSRNMKHDFLFVTKLENKLYNKFLL